MKTLKLAVLVLVATMLMLTAAFAVDAAPAAANPMGDALAGLIRLDVVPVLVSFLTALIGVALNQVRVKTGLQISSERQAQLEGLARTAVSMVEEKAAAYLKANTTKLTGQNKLDQAIAYIIAMAPTVSVERADALVHSVLGSTSSPAAGASGTAAV